MADDRNETPPWHPYCGCHGCRAGNALARLGIEGRKAPGRGEVMSDWHAAEADHWDRVEAEQYELDVAFVMQERERNEDEARRRREEDRGD